jgi:hypothetical protein
MALITDVIDVPDLIGFVRENAVLQGPTLASILPPLEVQDLTYELQNLEATTVEVASYRAWDTPPPLGARPGFSTIRGEIAPLGKSYTLNEREMARFTNLQRGLAGGSAADIYDDGLRAGLACQIRIEAARADLLTDGKVTINENGFNLEANFAVPAGHIVAPATPWSTTGTATPIANLKAYQATYRAANGGRNPDAWIISSEVAGDLSLSAELRNLAPVTGVVPGIIDFATVGNIIRAQGIAPLIVFDGQIPNAAGVMGPTLPVRKVIAVRAGMGDAFYGVPPAVQVLAASGVRLDRTEEPGIVVYVASQIRPARIITTGEAVALPVLRAPRALFVATV